MHSEQTRTNALISYLFLGWIFLLAKHNPHFQDPFIRSHAKNASLIHVITLWGFLLYSLFLAPHLHIAVPIILLDLDKIITVSFFAVLTFLIIKGAYRAYKGEMPDEKVFGKSYSLDLSKKSSIGDDYDEKDKSVFLHSFFPFFGWIVAKHFPHTITEFGARVSGFFTFLLIASTVFFGLSSFGLIFLFVYILLIVYVGFSLFIFNAIPNIPVLQMIPSGQEIYDNVRTLPLYFKDLILISFGKSGDLKFSEKRSYVRSKDALVEQYMESQSTTEPLFINPVFTYIPILNLIFLPRILVDRKSRYQLAMEQGLIITSLLIVSWYFFWIYSSYQLLLLFPIFLGVANVSSRPFYRVPVIHEIYLLLNLLTFGLLSQGKKMNEVRKKEEKVSFKIGE